MGETELDMAEAFFSIGVDCIRDVPEWTKLQHLLALVRARTGMGQAKLGFSTH